MTTRTSLVRIFSSPIQFFRTRAQMGPAWPLALAPIATDALIAAAGAAMAARAGRVATASVRVAADGGIGTVPPHVETILTIGITLSVAATLAVSFGFFILIAMAAVSVDVVFAHSGRARRLVEFTGYAYLVRLPWAVGSVAVTAWWWHPEPLSLPPSMTPAELPRLIASYQADLQSTPFQLTLRMVGMYSWLWVVGLQAGALHVVSGFGWLGACSAGGVIACFFVVMPWAWQRF